MNGTTLRALRMALGYTQQEAAILIGGVQLRSWQHWEESGKDIPDDVSEMVRWLCDWKAKAVNTALQQIEELASKQGQQPESIHLTYYTNENDWMTQDGAESMLWRPHCMAMAEIAAQSELVRLIKFRPVEYRAWLGNRTDDSSARSAWAAEQEA